MVWFIVGAIYALGMIIMFIVVRKIVKISKEMLIDENAMAPLIVLWPITLAVIIAAVVMAFIDYIVVLIFIIVGICIDSIITLILYDILKLNPAQGQLGLKIFSTLLLLAWFGFCVALCAGMCF